MEKKVDINNIYNNIHKKLKAIGIPNEKEGLFKAIQSLAFIGISNKQFSKEEIPGTLEVYEENKEYVTAVLNALYKSLAKTYAEVTIYTDNGEGKIEYNTIDNLVLNAKNNLEKLGVNLPKEDALNM